MRIALIWALDKNRIIGLKQGLPWRLPSDLKRFKQLTTGKPVIMGRKTWDSLPGPLPDRLNIVVSRHTHQSEKDEVWVDSLNEAVLQAQNWVDEHGHREVIVMGGAQIYKQAFDMADRLYVTEVDAEVEGDALLPEFDMSDFTLTEELWVDADEKDQFSYWFRCYDRNLTAGKSLITDK